MKTPIITFATLLGLLILSKLLQAQEYEYVPMPTKNAVWSNFEVDYMAPSESDTLNTLYAVFDEDTIVENIKCQKIYKVYDTILFSKNAYMKYLMYEENKKVFIKNLLIDEEFVLLYDFSLMLDDEFIMGLPPHTKMKVTKIDTILINDALRRRISFDMSYYLNDLSWIEGVGSTNGLFFPGTYVFGNSSTLLCLRENDNIIYYNNILNTCFPDYPKTYTKIKDDKKIEQLTIFPNPTSQNITLELPENASGVLSIFSIDGRIMLNKTFTINNTLNVSVAHFNEGVYIIQFATTNNKSVYRNYLIINK